MSQQANVAGDRNVLVQVAGNGNDIRIGPEGNRLELARRHRRPFVVKKEVDLLNPFSRAIPLVGRETELASLRAWLGSDAPISVRCLTGRGGSGKTRLALELCAWAEVQPEPGRWHAGFAAMAETPHPHLRGLADPGDWRWPARSLVVVDYAAAKARLLRDLLLALLDRADAAEGPLRLLLLERHADRELGWWPELSRPRDWPEEGLPDLFDPPEPVPLPSLATAEHQRAVLGAVMAAASRLAGRDPPLRPPPPGQDPHFDARLADPSLVFEPLHLAMAGLNAVHAGVDRLLAIPRPDLADKVAGWELGRIARLAGARGLGPEFLQHMAAIVTLTGGAARDGLENVIADELKALGYRSAGDPPAIAAALREALPDEADGEQLAPILPDIVGEAAILTVLGKRPVAQQVPAVARAAAGARTAVASTVIRTVQDHADRDDHAALVWLEALIAGSAPAEILVIADQFPESTIRLRHLAASVQESIVATLRASAANGDADASALLPSALNNLGVRLGALGRREAAPAAAAGLYRELAAARPDAFRPDLATALNNLAGRLSELGRREAALAAAEEAADLFRRLAAARPDAFRHYLATSLMVLGNCLEGSRLLPEALAAIREALEVIAPAFLALPQAFAELTDTIVQIYARRAEALGQAPDMALLTSILATFQRLQADTPEDGNTP